MTNKEIIQKVNEGFAEDDVEKILQYVADDVRWDVMGISTAIGKDAFRKQADSEYFTGKPIVKINYEIEQNNQVIVEGEMQCKKADGGILDAFFIDVYSLQNGMIKEMRSYIVEKNKSFY